MDAEQERAVGGKNGWVDVGAGPVEGNVPRVWHGYLLNIWKFFNGKNKILKIQKIKLKVQIIFQNFPTFSPLLWASQCAGIVRTAELHDTLCELWRAKNVFSNKFYLNFLQIFISIDFYLRNLNF